MRERSVANSVAKRIAKTSMSIKALMLLNGSVAASSIGGDIAWRMTTCAGAAYQTLAAATRNGGIAAARRNINAPLWR